MRISIIVGSFFTISVAALLMIPTVSSFAQSADTNVNGKQDVSSDARKNDVKAGDEKGGKKPLATFDADLNDDGIIDSVATLTSVKTATAADLKRSGNESQQKLTTAFRAAPQIQHPLQRSSCMDYLLLSPQEQARVIQKVQTRTVAVFGTRPCEPFVSPHLERPFDTNYAEIPFFPFPGVSIILRD